MIFIYMPCFFSLIISIYCTNIVSSLFDLSNKLALKYGIFTETQRHEMLDQARKMFYYGYDNYMHHAFPADELDPINCRGRGPDLVDASNININDVLGNYSLTLIDSLDTLAILGNANEFKRAVYLVVKCVSFDNPNTVQVFESNIRVMGGLLSAHLLITKAGGILVEKDFRPEWYDNELLTLAHDLADRLLMAFEGRSIPFPRVNLKYGVPVNASTHSCTAGVGSLVLEFGILSRLLDDPTYELHARRAVDALWNLRDKKTNLFGNVFDIENGKWQYPQTSGVGAGLDSFFEYLFKSHILFGPFPDEGDLERFSIAYDAIKQYMRRGRLDCNSGIGSHPLYVNVHMKDGQTANTWVDSLQASFSALQVLFGDVDEAICHHAYYYALWRRFGVIPERYDWQNSKPLINFYPLRPELAESTYFLYRATRNPFYLYVGRDIIRSLNNYTLTTCGYATIHNVLDKTLEDRQESFFLAETCKYLFLLFDESNPLHKVEDQIVFTTEGHVFPILPEFRKGTGPSRSTASCSHRGFHDNFKMPLDSQYLMQLFNEIGSI